MKADLSFMKEQINYFRAQIRVMAEPQEELEQMLLFLKRIVEDQDWVLGEERPNPKLDFLLNEYVPGLARTMALNSKLVFKNEKF